MLRSERTSSSTTPGQFCLMFRSSDDVAFHGDFFAEANLAFPLMMQAMILPYGFRNLYQPQTRVLLAAYDPLIRGGCSSGSCTGNFIFSTLRSTTD